MYSGDLTIFNMHSLPYNNFKVRVEFINAGDIDKYGHANHEDHQMNVKFTMIFVNRDYTKFEFFWKYTFVFVTLVSGRFSRSAEMRRGSDAALTIFRCLPLLTFAVGLVLSVSQPRRASQQEQNFHLTQVSAWISRSDELGKCAL